MDSKIAKALDMKDERLGMVMFAALVQALLRRWIEKQTPTPSVTTKYFSSKPINDFSKKMIYLGLVSRC